MALPENIPTTRQEVWALLKAEVEAAEPNQNAISLLQNILMQLTP